MVKLDLPTSQKFELGKGVSDILREISLRISTPKNPLKIDVSPIKSQYNPANKLANWNYI